MDTDTAPKKHTIRAEDGTLLWTGDDGMEYAEAVARLQAEPGGDGLLLELAPQSPD